MSQFGFNGDPGAQPLDYTLLLPPSQIEECLDTFREAGPEARTDFEDLLRTPFLQDIKIPSPADAETRTGSAHLKSVSAANGATKTLYPLISEGMTNFISVQIVDTSVSRNLAAYAGLIPVLVQSLPRGELASSLSAMVSKYVTEATAKATNTKKFFSEFYDSVQHMSTTTTSLAQDLAQIRKEISNVEEEISAEGQSFLQRVTRRLHKYLNSTNGTTESILVTLALILNMSVEELKKLFEQPEDGDAKRELLEHLHTFETRLSHVHESLSNLQEDLTKFMNASSSLMSVWNDIAVNLSSLALSEDDGELFSTAQQSLIAKQWGKVRREALAFIDQAGRGTSSSIGSASSIPQRFVSRGVSTLRAISSNLRVVFRQAVDLQSDTEQSILKDLSLDPGLLDKIEMMSNNSGHIVASFNKILEIPFLNSLKVTYDPDDNNNSEGLDLLTLTTRYLNRYLTLQARTVPFARTLIGYSNLQRTIIPHLGKDLSISEYVKANASIISKHRAEAQEVYNDHLHFKEKWNLAVISLQRAINEQNQSIASMEDQIRKLAEKKKDLTIFGALAIVGGVLFTALSFATGGLLFALMVGVGVGLGVTAFKLLSSAEQLGAAIDAYQTAINTAKEVVDQLETVLPIMKEVLELLQAVTGIWNTVTNSLAKLETSVETWNILASSPTTLQVLLKDAESSWEEIMVELTRYVSVVSGSNPEVSKM